MGSDLFPLENQFVCEQKTYISTKRNIGEHPSVLFLFLFQRGNAKQLWDSSLVHRQHQHDNDDGGDDDNYNHPEYSNMENMYNETKDSEKPHHIPTGNHGNQGVWNQAYVKSNKTKVQSGIQNMEFDSGAVNNNTSPPKKDRPPFGHRPLTSETGKKSASEFIVGRPISRPESAKMGQGQSLGSTVKSRPSSGKTYMAPVNATSIGAYLQMKKAGKLNLPAKTTGQLNSFISVSFTIICTLQSV